MKCTLSILTAFSVIASAGTVAPTLAPPPPANPLSFADGRIVLDFENQTRFEFRENNFDFDNSVDSLTDDAWMLNRFRAGMLLKPSDWVRFYFQAQDKYVSVYTKDGESLIRTPLA